jgi:hypothetical protein
MTEDALGLDGPDGDGAQTADRAAYPRRWRDFSQVTEERRAF